MRKVPNYSVVDRSSLRSAIILAGTTTIITIFTVFIVVSGSKWAIRVAPVDTVWPLLVLAIASIMTLLTFLVIFVTLEFADRVALPRVSGFKAFSIIGASGIVGIGVALGLLLGSDSRFLGVQTDLEHKSITAVVVVTILLSSLYIHFLQPGTERSSPTWDPGTLDPITFKDKMPDTGSQSPSLAERKQRAIQHRQNSGQPTDGRAKESTDESVESDDIIENVDTEFQWAVETGVSFDDVGGMEEVKKEIRQEIIIPIKDRPQRAEQLGVSASNIIFFGPPGTEKTYMAEALATELELPFVQLSGSNIQSKWINESAQKVDKLFSEARAIAAKSGGAVIFLDELDSVLKSRDGNQNSHDEDLKVVNEFLSKLENTEEDEIVFVGATNRVDALDAAGIRSGRIDKKIHIGIPDEETRKEILRTQLDSRPHNLTTDCIETAASLTEGLVAADLAQLVDTAAKKALVSGGEQITAEEVRLALQELSSDGLLEDKSMAEGPNSARTRESVADCEYDCFADCPVE